MTLSNLQAVSQKVAALGRSIGVSPTNVRKGIVGGPEMITSGMSHHREAKLSRTIKGSEYISDRPWLFGQLATSNPKDWAWLLSPSVNRRPDVIIFSMAFLNYFKGVVRQKKLRRTTNGADGANNSILNLFPENLSASPFLELNNSCKSSCLGSGWKPEAAGGENFLGAVIATSFWTNQGREGVPVRDRLFVKDYFASGFLYTNDGYIAQDIFSNRINVLKS